MVMRIRELRRAAGMNQKQLADNMGVTQNTVSNWETEVCLPRARQLPELARQQRIFCCLRLFDCTIDELFCEYHTA